VSFGLAQLRKSELSVYYHRYDQWIGNSVEQLLPLSHQPIVCASTPLRPLRSGFEVVGWIAPKKWSSVQQIVIAEKSGRIVSFGRQLPAGLLAPQSSVRKFIPTWVGFVPLTLADSGSNYDIIPIYK